MHRILLLFLACCFSIITKAQYTLEGTILGEGKESLAFVNILIDEGEGVFSDIDGRFTINSKEPIEVLQISFVGYETISYNVATADYDSPLVFQMKLMAFALQEAVVIAGENPAHRIIRKVVENRDQNNPDKLQSYTCQTYNKVVFDWLPNRAAIEAYEAPKGALKKLRQKRLDNIKRFATGAEDFHLFIMESVSNRSFLYPEHNKEEVIYNRVSGFNDPSFVALANDVQPFSFYQDHLTIIDKTFLNPISPNSTKQYFFNIQDTLYQDRDTVFIISYEPKKGKNFEGLKGLLYINTNKYAIQNVVAEPYDKSNINMKIEQQYAFAHDQHWFPQQLNFELEAARYPDKFLGTKVAGKSYISNIVLNPELNKKDFSSDAYTISEDANSRNDSLLLTHRLAPLTPKELLTYEVVDSLGIRKNFDTKLKLSETLITGHFPIGMIDLALYRLLELNDYEEFRTGLGLYTNDKLSKYLTTGGYVSYGFGDKAWKYGGEFSIHSPDRIKWQLQLLYKNDVREPGLAEFITYNSIVGRQFFANRMDAIEEISVAAMGQVWEYTHARLRLSQQKIQPNYAYAFSVVDADSEQYQFTEGSINLRFAYGEQFVQVLGSTLSEGTKYPIVQVGYTRGFKEVLGGEYNYQKWIASIEDSFLTRALGETSFLIEAALVDKSLPFPKLYTVSGLGRDFEVLIINNVFQTMDSYEFLSDRFVHFFVKHDFGTRLFKSKKFRPDISIHQNIGFGSLRNPLMHQELAFKTMEKGYYEAGIVLDNIIRLNYLNIAYVGIGFGTFYRYGPYQFSTTKDNFAFRMNLDFTL